MYTEEKPRRGNLLKEFIMRLILIVIFVLLLIWLVPWPNMDSYINSLNPLKDQIFNSNLQTMKDAGITYFTSERLPKEVGDKTTLTLQQMLDMKLLIPFTDRNGNSCDVTKSYISLEKKETEYIMKVNLKCGEEEDYILVHLGCYSYCTTDICEAKPEEKEKSSTTPKQKSNDNIVPTTKPTYTPTAKPTITPTYTPPMPKYQCALVDGKYWGKNFTVVNYETYVDECVPKTPTPKYKCALVDGKYWGKDYTVVDQKTYEKQCTAPTPPTPKYQCALVDGQYWGKNFTVVDQKTFEDECIPKKPEPKYQCAVVDGKYWGKDYTVVSKAVYEQQCITPTPVNPVYICSIVNGVYYDNKGTVTNQANYNKICNGVVPTPNPTAVPSIYCSIINGIYYDNKGNVTNQANYNKICNTTIIVNPVTYTCKYVNGQYWGKDSTVVDQKTYESQCVSKPTPTPPTQTVKKQYEYKKETSTYYPAQYTAWSNWKEYVKKTGENITFEKTNTKEVEDLGTRYVKIGTKSAVYDKVVITKPYQELVKTVKYSVCREYEYVIETITTVTTTTTTTTTHSTPGYTVTEGGQQLVQINGEWHDTGEKYQGYNPPQDTASSRWIFDGVDFSQCSDCVNHPYAIYHEQKRNTTTYTINGESTQTPTGGGSSSSSNSSSSTSVEERVKSSGCSDLVEKEIPVYGTRIKTTTKTVLKEPAKDIYAHIPYYRVRTRELISKARLDIKIDYKWSSYNDTSLLNTGYSYTGKTRTIN